jgi:heme/copper-type cytochrome/quinol oxidase subunit 1
MLSEALGKWSFWLMFVGTLVTFMIQHSLGLDGMPRRVYEYPTSATCSSTTRSRRSARGSSPPACCDGDQRLALAEARTIAGPDPWKANTLEWFTTSPPPVNNFDEIPRVRSLEPMKDIRREVERQSKEGARRAPSPGWGYAGEGPTA